MFSFTKSIVYPKMNRDIKKYEMNQETKDMQRVVL